MRVCSRQRASARACPTRALRTKTASAACPRFSFYFSSLLTRRDNSRPRRRSCGSATSFSKVRGERAGYIHIHLTARRLQTTISRPANSPTFCATTSSTTPTPTPTTPTQIRSTPHARKTRRPTSSRIPSGDGGTRGLASATRKLMRLRVVRLRRRRGRRVCAAVRWPLSRCRCQLSFSSPSCKDSLSLRHSLRSRGDGLRYASA
jgi:hypothetical protein